MKTRDFFCMTIVFVLTGVLLLGATQAVYAAGTASGIDIENRATINYKVNSIDQTVIESSPTGNSTAGSGAGADTSFKVDNKVDLTVTTVDTGPVSVTPGGSGYYLTFLVSNEGNTVQDYHLDSTAVVTDANTSFGGSVKDAFDMTSVNIFVDDGDGNYEPLEDTATYIDELAADANIFVFIVASAPLAATNGQYASYHLTATTRNGDTISTEGSVTEQTTGPDTASVDVVFADGAGSNDSTHDGKHSSQDDYKCVSSVLTITKTSSVKSDPINNITNPKRIPGAVVEYTITVANDEDAATATNIKVSDDLSVEIGAGTIEFDPNGYELNKGIYLTSPSLTSALSNALDTDQGSFNDPNNPNSVVVTGITLDGDESATVQYKVIIQ